MERHSRIFAFEEPKLGKKITHADALSTPCGEPRRMRAIADRVVVSRGGARGAFEVLRYARSDAAIAVHAGQRGHCDEPKDQQDAPHHDSSNAPWLGMPAGRSSAATLAPMRLPSHRDG